MIETTRVLSKGENNFGELKVFQVGIVMEVFSALIKGTDNATRIRKS